MIRYIVTGAAGHLGSTIIRNLSGLGDEIYGLLLNGEKEKVSGPNIRYYSGNVCEIDSLRRLFRDAGDHEIIVIHTAAIISIDEKIPRKLIKVNIRGTKNIIKLCWEYGVKRLVHVSSVHAIPELPHDQIIKEVNTYTAHSVFGGYAKTKAVAAQAVMDAIKCGMDAVIMFPSGIVGPYDDGQNHLVQMAKDYMAGKLKVCVKGGYNLVDVRDVALGCIRAAKDGRRGEGYILSGHYVSIKDFLNMVGQYSGNKEISVMPTWMAKAAVPFIANYARIFRKRPLYTRYSLNALKSNSNFSNEKAEWDLGFSPRSIEDTTRDMVEWLKGKKV